MFELEKIVRKNIISIQPYHVWRDTYLENPETIFLDNCENNFGSLLGKGYERYPSSSQSELRKAVAEYKQLNVANITLGNGSDEIIDLLIRCFCEPGYDSILVCEPTFGMYRIYAQLNNIEVLNAPLKAKSFLFDADLVLKTIKENTKLIFLCSPNNPTGTSISHDHIKTIVENFSGLVVVDEAYIDFSDKRSALNLLREFPNLVVLQTFSKAWGLASLRVGAAYGPKEVITILNKVRPPFNISETSQRFLLQALKKADQLHALINAVLAQKQWLKKELKKLSVIKTIIESDANFFLLEVEDSAKVHRYLLDHLILISNRSSMENCHNHIRISVGTEAENQKLITLLNQYA